VWDFKRLTVWQRARVLIGEIYRLTSTFPTVERFGLTTQLRRAANSIGANLAEAGSRTSQRERAHILEIAIGSADELEHHLVIAFDIGLIEPESKFRLADEVDQIRRMLKALHAGPAAV
jgi:four helix bundle protein